jgi:lipid II:glycine glycyltransferase (peptidoglycan interpeptide bridge formation enzyme)
MNKNNLDKIRSILKKGVLVKILTDDADEIFSKLISELNLVMEIIR